MTDTQLELGFGNAAHNSMAKHDQRQIPRANWWVTRMRQLAERVFNWRPDPPPRPEQIYFGTSGL